jgi:hypothetical protein
MGTLAADTWVQRRHERHGKQDRDLFMQLIPGLLSTSRHVGQEPALALQFGKPFRALWRQILGFGAMEINAFALD